jgi:hypothetical protein
LERPANQILTVRGLTVAMPAEYLEVIATRA